jgi:hypothetical protein
MNMVQRADQYNIDNVYFCDPIKNNVMSEGKFIRVLYSTPAVVLKGVSLVLTLHDAINEEYYNKYKCIFNTLSHRSMIEHMRQIEVGLLDRAGIIGKVPHYKIFDQLRNGYIKLFLDPCDKDVSSQFVLKISGVWETEHFYGLTYKFTRARYP